MDPEEKFSDKDVRNELDDRRTYRARLIKEVKIDVELYNQEFKLDVPEGFHQIKSPASKAICDRFADRLGGGRMSVHMEPRKNSIGEKEHVEDLEAASKAIVYLASRRVKYNPVRAMALHSANRGAFVVKAQLDLDAMKIPLPGEFKTRAAFEQAKKLNSYRQLSRFPLVMDVRPIESIFPDTESDGDNSVIEHYRRRVGSIKKNYPTWEGWNTSIKRKATKKYNDQDLVDFSEIWTSTWRGAMVDEQWIPIGKAAEGPVPNLLGRPPYWLRYAGYGDPSAEPHLKCVSLLRAIRDVVRSDSRILSIIDTLAENEAYGATLLKKGDSGNLEFNIGPGAINEMDEPLQVKPFTLPGIQQGTLDAHSIMQAAIEMGAVPSEAIGQPSAARGKGTPSGIAAALLTGQASMIVDPTKDAIQQFLSDFIPWTLYAFDAVAEIKELPLYAQVGPDQFVQITLTPDVIDGHYGPVFATLELREPEDDYAREQTGLQALQAGAPEEWVFEHFFRIDNSEAFVREMYAKRVAHSPAVFDYLTQRLIERLQAKSSNSAEKLPGQNVVAPANYSVPVPVDPYALPPGPPAAAGGPNPNGSQPKPGPPADPRVRAESRIANTGAAHSSLPPQVTTGTL